ncbi:amino acid-binding protein [Draconibacterium halophilum]|uniref:Amino acid-binding protein n=1 Tax=Draconibacterium halophilum TaxID=2706887 RepID=A0A6C0RET9_9BACT|nr:amino acid-binding protein [Draconibacterium halophilum]QIA08043.1 amino acid-binding protein [Draconibacterium halophilum]
MAYEVSIFLENKIGHFERITSVLKEAQINIRSMAINDTANGWGILNLIVNDPKKAKKALSEKGVSVALRKVIALEMRDEAGGLDDLLMEVARAEVNFDNAVGRVITETQKAILILNVDDYAESIKKLKKQGVQIIDDQTVYGTSQ